MKKKSKPTFLEVMAQLITSALKLPQFKEWFTALIWKILKTAPMGGIRGWLIENLVKYFTNEVIDTVRIATDYNVIKKRDASTATDSDRSRATDTLNQW